MVAVVYICISTIYICLEAHMVKWLIVSTHSRDDYLLSFFHSKSGFGQFIKLYHATCASIILYSRLNVNNHEYRVGKKLSELHVVYS